MFHRLYDEEDLLPTSKQLQEAGTNVLHLHPFSHLQTSQLMLLHLMSRNSPTKATSPALALLELSNRAGVVSLASAVQADLQS